MKIRGITLARVGAKSVPRKNIRLILCTPYDNARENIETV